MSEWLVHLAAGTGSSVTSRNVVLSFSSVNAAAWASVNDLPSAVSVPLAAPAGTAAPPAGFGLAADADPAHRSPTTTTDESTLSFISTSVWSRIIAARTAEVTGKLQGLLRDSRRALTPGPRIGYCGSPRWSGP